MQVKSFEGFYEGHFAPISDPHDHHFALTLHIRGSRDGLRHCFLYDSLAIYLF